MIDNILFIVLVVFVFLIGINYNKEGFQTQPDDLYQTEPIKSLTKKLNEYLQALTSSIGIMVSTIETNITSMVNEKLDWIKGCTGCVKFCGKEPYWGTCSREDCVPKVGGGEHCTTTEYGCWQTRDNCGPKLPEWKCDGNPTGFSIPSPPTGWTGISKRSC